MRPSDRLRRWIAGRARNDMVLKVIPGLTRPAPDLIRGIHAAVGPTAPVLDVIPDLIRYPCGGPDRLRRWIAGRARNDMALDVIAGLDLDVIPGLTRDPCGGPGRLRRWIAGRARNDNGT